MKGNNIAYVRVSSVTQNEERQIAELKKYNIDKWFIEKVSAKDRNRPEFCDMMKFIREGDSIYIMDFSRIARSLVDLLAIIEELKEKKVFLISLKENIDSSTSTGKLLLTVIGAINEFERENLLERQREGIAIAKLNGKYKGRNVIKKPSNWNEVYIKYKTRQISAKKAMELMGLKRNTFYRMVKEADVVKQNLQSNKNGWE